MNKSSRFLAECNTFLESIVPKVEVKPVELVKPFPESKLHEMTAEAIIESVKTARKTQHLLVQFSEAEIAHLQFMDEARDIVEYKQLLAVQPPITEAAKPAADVEQIDELSRATLKGVVNKVDDTLASYVLNKDKKMGDINKHIKFALAAKNRLKTKAKETSMDESASLDEGMPLKGHAYHSKTDAELNFIVKDAGEAARAMKDHSPASEGKYLDQMNDASTVLHYRKNGVSKVAKPKLEESFGRTGALNRIKNLLG